MRFLLAFVVVAVCGVFVGPARAEKCMENFPWQGAVPEYTLVDHFPEKIRPFVLTNNKSVCNRVQLLPNGDVVNDSGIPYNLFKWPFPVDRKKDGYWSGKVFCNSRKAYEAYFKGWDKSYRFSHVPPKGPHIDDTSYRDLFKTGQCFGELHEWLTTNYAVPGTARKFIQAYDVPTSSGVHRIWGESYETDVD